MSDYNTQELCAEWQKLLRLQDWQVQINMVRAVGMHREGSGGEVNWHVATKAAVISITDPIDYPENAICPLDIERTIVHELLHLHFVPFVADDGTPEDESQEQVIHILSEALVKIKREREE